jgi:hypothetical protein
VVEHILLMRWKDQTNQEAIDRAMEALRGFKQQIAGIVELSCGPNFSERSQGYTHGLVVRFKDRAALDAYFPHPEHQRVVQNLIKPYSADTLILDYEF